MPDFAFTQSSRHVVDGAEVVSTPSGLSIVVRQLDAGWWVEVRASAMSDTMLVKFAATLGIVGGAVEDGSGLLRTLRLRPVEKLASADDALYGRVDNESSYALGKGGGLITLHVAPPSFRSADTDHLGYFATALATDADGHVRGLLRDDSEAFVTWLAHGHRFTITGSVDVNTLDGFSRELAAVDENGWRGRMYGLHPDYRLGPFTVNGGGTAIGGTKWSAGVQQATRGGRSWFLWWWTLPQHPERSASVEVPVDLHGRFYADTVVVAGATYVFVSSGDDPERLPVMVTGGDGVRRTVRMSHVNGEQRLLVGVQRIDAPGEVTIEFGR
jgi:hypothetical protein